VAQRTQPPQKTIWPHENINSSLDSSSAGSKSFSCFGDLDYISDSVIIGISQVKPSTSTSRNKHLSCINSISHNARLQKRRKSPLQACRRYVLPHFTHPIQEDSYMLSSFARPRVQNLRGCRHHPRGCHSADSNDGSQCSCFG
jgi:hypothetical protein